MLAGYLGFYAWYAAKYSYKSLNINFWAFEKKTSMVPVFIILIYLVVTIIEH
jgi:hypothetical protein